MDSNWTRLQQNMTSEVSKIECGHLANFHFDIFSKCFQELISIAKKLESEVQSVK